MKKVFCLYSNGNHIQCFKTFEEAEHHFDYPPSDMDIEEEDYEPDCDCKFKLEIGE